MTSEETNEDIVETIDAAETSPGELLAKRREELGFGIQQVADQLHITMHYVRALETNAHDKLPGDIFVRGYIRSYASLLGLDAEVMVNVYKHYASHRECVEQSAKKTSRRRRRDKNLPWFVVSAIALISVAIALWYFSAEESSEAVAELPAQTSSRTAVALDNVAPSVSSATRQSVNLGTPASAVAVLVAEELIVGDVALEDEVAEELVAVVTDIEALQEIAQNAEPAISATQSIEMPEADVPVLTPAATQMPEIPEQVLSVGQVINVDAGGDDVLTITFSGESIVQIDDSSEKQIYRDIRVAGDVLEVTGSAPFNILLGDAASTALTFNGSEIDFRTNIRVDNSARLTIGL